MREIEFRAWCKTEKSMINILYDIYYIIKKRGVYTIHDIIGSSLKENYELMQYIGLQDKNGVEIFEGDIVKIDNSRWHEKDYIGIIEHGENISCDGNIYFGFYINWINNNIIRKDIYFWVTNRNIEVIGNIYENPDLLENDNA